jgi:hypothetical protein
LTGVAILMPISDIFVMIGYSACDPDSFLSDLAPPVLRTWRGRTFLKAAALPVERPR